MISIDKLLEFAYNFGIKIIYRDLHHEQHPGLDGYADAEKKLIVLDISLKYRPRHHKCVLAEEIGHIIFPSRPGHIAYHMRGYQQLDHIKKSSVKAIVAQDERRALSWATGVLIPDVEFWRAKENGVDSVYAFADRFNVKEWFVMIKIGFLRRQAKNIGQKLKWRDIINRH